MLALLPRPRSVTGKAAPAGGQAIRLLAAQPRRAKEWQPAAITLRNLRHQTMAELSPQPHRGPCSSRRAGSFTAAVVAESRRPQPHVRNKQGTSNSGTQPPTTITSMARIHARSGQPLTVTLNGTVRVLTYKQEAGGSSPSPPLAQSLQMRCFEALLGRMWRHREQATRHSALESRPNVVGGAVGRRRAECHARCLRSAPDQACSLLVPSEGVVSLSPNPPIR
jgi:hypothetical protein